MSRLLCLLSLALAISGAARAERLPLRQYGIIDGLAADSVNHVFRDSRGFMWFCTSGGLTRFDGRLFVSYGVEHGLPVDVVIDMAEDPSGVHWVATWGGGGIARFNPRSTDPARLFTPYRLGDGSSDRSTALLVDRSGKIWVGTAAGLFVRNPDADSDAPFLSVDLGAVSDAPRGVRVHALTEDRHGNLWIATPEGLVRRSAAGDLRLYPITEPPAADQKLRDVIEDRAGRIWVAHPGGVTVLHPRHDSDRGAPDSPARDATAAAPCVTGPSEEPVRLPNAPGESCLLGIEDLPGPGQPTGLFEASDGHVWIVRYSEGLTEFDGSRLRTYGEADGVGGYLTSDLTEDAAGNLWLASLDSGALRIARTGFTAYDRADGLGYTRRARLAESLDGEVAVIAGPSVHLFDGERFETIRLEVLEGLGQASSDMSIVLHDHTGQWWFGTRRGLFRYGAAESMRQLVGRQPIEAFTEGGGLPGNVVECLLEDSAGDIWIGVDASEPVVRWERSTGTLHRYSDLQELGAPSRPLAFAEDGAGQIWVGFARRIARFRDGRFTTFARDDGLTADVAVRPYVDRSGRLWLVSGYAGVTRIDDPAAERPSFSHRYTKAEGLASDPVACAVEDRFGRMYFCTTKGVDRLEPSTGRIRHYTSADGLSTTGVVYGMRDRSGALWFTSMRGVSRLVPRADPPAPPPPPVWITEVRVMGVPVVVSEMGESEISGLRLEASRNQVEIDVASPSFEIGDEIRYRYRLGGEARDWSAPTPQQSINFASLSSGLYRLEVKAVNSYGVESVPPATVDFRILPPLWRRWWSLTLGALVLAGIVYGAHRLRVARMVALERVRTRIATDLHDDIGASLSQITILTEVLNRRKDLDSSTSRTYLSRIADSSRELVDSMADIVWAINPKRDRLSDLVQRMRRFLGDAVTGREIEYTFHAPPEERDLRLGPDVRRQLFLVFKESVNNAVRHSACGRVNVRLTQDGSTLQLEIEDDGKGFDVSQEYDGNGLESIKRRARELGGDLDLDSRPGRGSVVRIEAPLGRRKRSAGRRRHLNR
jgi:signal transduction histidine kinase/ligand-binding sensor domain-containing protein